MKYIIYCIKNEVNGKVYIGYTSKSINERFISHIKKAKNKINRRLYDSMNHYGYDNFKISELDVCDDKNTAHELESWYIFLFKSKNPNYGYNMTNGGDGGYTLTNWKDEDISDLYKRQAVNRKKTLIAKYGVEHVTQIDGVKKKISEKLKGRVITDAHKNKISNILKEKYKNGEIVANISGLKSHKVGEFKHSNITKEKLSKFRKGKSYEELFDVDTVNRLKEQKKKQFSGKNNPLYVENLNIEEQKQFIQFLIDNKRISYCVKYFNKSAYKLRQLLRQYGIDNIQKLKNTDKENKLLIEILNML